MSLEVEISEMKRISKAATFVGFEIEREGWNWYSIEDGTLLRGRVLLLNVRMEGKLDEMVNQLKPRQKRKLGLGLNLRHVYSVESPSRLLGNSDPKTYTVAELKSSIVKEDMNFETRRELWNIYKLANGITAKIRLSPTTINRTDKFDRAGIPIYTIDATVHVKFELPNHIRKILDKKGKLGIAKANRGRKAEKRRNKS